MNLVKASLKYPAIPIFFAFLMVCFGVYAFFKMPRTEDPVITIRTGLVIASYPGASSEEVEKQVTKVLEKHVLKFEEVYKEKTFSTSRNGLCIINVELEEFVKDADLFWTRLRHELNEARYMELPAGVRGVMVNSDFGDTVAMLIAVHGEAYGYRELRDFADRIQDEMRTVRDVGKLSVYGTQNEEIEVAADLKRMSRFSVTPSELMQVIQARNVTGNSGTFDAETSSVPVKADGMFTSLDDVKSLLLDVSPTGQPLYLKDLAEVTRTYTDPDFVVRYDGKPSVIISVEMQKGKNIVEFGDRLSEVFTRLDSVLPSDLKMDMIADQPKVVDDRMKKLAHEFLLAIASVITVTIILLPLRVAVIAAVAIPVTLCATLAVMNIFGIALHQVSIASLILVLGIVVDDAIVIADNYVDLLDRKVPREKTGWMSVKEVLVPVFTATITIICAFLPLIILKGSVGEFIIDLPLTVTTALSLSFIVAIFLTPTICRVFIKRGLHREDKNQKFNLLDTLQNSYAKQMSFFMRYKSIAIGIGIISIAAGIMLYQQIPQEFFPSAERNQFVIDVWMPQGTRIESTQETVEKIENKLNDTDGVNHFASFTGQSAPRFYYNVSPQQPDSAYAQFIVNTASIEDTRRIVGQLRSEFTVMVPEAMVIVKELQQGQQIEAPVEVRISGYDIKELHRAAEEVKGIIRQIPYSIFIHDNYFNDSVMADLDVDNELAGRLGISNHQVASTIAGALDGQPVSVYREGDRAIPIVFRLPEAERLSFADITDAYVTSPVTGKAVSLRSFTDIKPEWESSRIVRRNGVRTITVRCFVKHGYYASDLLKTIKPLVAGIDLPAGYRVEYGGEEYNKNSTMPQMTVALGISLLAIFSVLLVQFRNVREPLIVMSSILLSILGAMTGLWITGNSYGFTAFMGLISLCGIVVRNSIILIDYIKEKMADGHGIEQAATEAGQRRLRPIFLTTMAAAVGVTPMILSGSSLWSPLASVLAVGLIFSMFFTLLVVPVLYVIVMKSSYKKSAAALVILFMAFHANADTKTMTLDEAVSAALKNSRAVKIAAAGVHRYESREKTARSDYFPHLSASLTHARALNKHLVTVPSGEFGSVGGFPMPPYDYNIDRDGNTTMINATIAQPLTQLLKINENVGAAEADTKISKADLNKARDEIILAVKQLYYGLLIADSRQKAFSSAVEAAEEAVKENRDSLESGNVLKIKVIEAQAGLLKNRQYLMQAEIQYEDLNSDLNILTGQPEGTVIIPDSGFKRASELSESDYLKTAEQNSQDVIAAEEQLQKAKHGLNASKYEYIPDISLFASHIHLDNVPYINDNITTVGIKLDWDILDWGRRSGIKGERSAQLIQASQNLMRVKEQLRSDVSKAYRRITLTKRVLQTASKAYDLYKEKYRITGDMHEAGLVSDAVLTEGRAEMINAKADLTAAELDHELSIAQMNRLISER